MIARVLAGALVLTLLAAGVFWLRSDRLGDRVDVLEAEVAAHEEARRIALQSRNIADREAAAAQARVADLEAALSAVRSIPDANRPLNPGYQRALDGLLARDPVSDP